MNNFTLKKGVIEGTFGEPIIIICNNEKEILRISDDMVRSIEVYGIDPCDEVSSMVAYELNDPSVKEQIYDLLLENMIDKEKFLEKFPRCAK